MLSAVGGLLVKSFMVDDNSGRLLVSDNLDKAGGSHDTIYNNGWPYKRIPA
jgi:hypothetical protein